MGREPPLDRREEHPADGDHGPERGQRDRRRGGRRAELGGHVELGPVAVHGLADAVEHGEGGVQPEAGRDAGRAVSTRRGGGRFAGPQRQPDADEQQRGEQHRREHREAPPEAETDEDGHEQRGQRGAQPEQGVEREHGSIDRRRVERRRERVDRRHGEPESGAEKGRRQQEQPVGHRLIVGEQRARNEQAHRHEAGRQPDEVDPLGAEPAGQAGAEQRAGDRRDHLGKEHRAVLAAATGRTRRGR